MYAVECFREGWSSIILAMTGKVFLGLKGLLGNKLPTDLK